MKKTIQTIVLAALCLFLSNRTLAQTVALKIGDQVPDITINNIINYKSSSAKLSDFKGKLLILDFWATWCGSCIKAMPKLDSLQTEFEDQVQVISVTKQDQNTVEAFKLKNLIVHNYNVPIATGDKSLSAAFPHRMVPHIVWISPERRLLASTSAYDVNSKAIQDILKDREPNFKDIKVDILTFDSSKPLFDNGNGGEGEYIYRSLLTGFTSGLPAQSGFKRDDKNFRLYATNAALSSLYRIAMDLPRTWKLKRIIMEGEAARYLIDDFSEQKKVGSWCYELSVPLARESEAKTMMLNDLNRYFNLQAKLENRETECLAMVRTETGMLTSAGGAKKNNFASNNKEFKFISNQPLSTLVKYLDELNFLLPVLDETGYTSSVDLKLNADLRNTGELNKALIKYGLQLIPVRRKMNMLVIKTRILTNKKNIL